jgi:hypothetical protein
MADPKYDLIFSGELTPGTDPGAVRERIRELFKLTDDTLEKLFSGRPVAIKRGVDTATAVRFRDAFRDAGAVVQVLPGEQVEATGFPEDQATGEPGAGDGELRLAPADDKPLETAPEIPPLTIDISYLQLIPGDGWTLEDCAPPTPPVRIPDIGHLTLVEPEPIERRETPED